MKLGLFTACLPALDLVGSVIAEEPDLLAERTAGPHRAGCAELFSIAQYGSTRSINAGVASGIAMHAWIRAHAAPPPTGGAGAADA